MLMAATPAHGWEVLELLEPHCTDIREHPGNGRGRDVRRGVGPMGGPRGQGAGRGPGASVGALPMCADRSEERAD